MKPVRRVLLLIAPVLALAAVLSCSHGREQQQAAPLSAVRHPDRILAGGMPPPGTAALHNPAPGDPDSVKAGERLFASMNCDSCHGPGGFGAWAPSLADGRFRYGGRDEEIFESVFYGRPNGMPAYGGVIGPDGIWMLVNYVKSLPPPGGISPTQSWIDTPPAAAQPDPDPENTAAPAEDAASAPPDLAASSRKYGCVACHAVDQKVVGPAFREVAAKYREQPEAGDRLFASVRNGSVGTWGTIPMPPHAGMSDAELRQIVAQILSLE